MSEINTSTKEGRIHSSIGTDWDVAEVKTGSSPITALPDLSSVQTGFIKASEFPLPKKRLAHASKDLQSSHDSCFEGFKSASSLLTKPLLVNSDQLDQTNKLDKQDKRDKLDKPDKTKESMNELCNEVERTDLANSLKKFDCTTSKPDKRKVTFSAIITDNTKRDVDPTHSVGASDERDVVILSPTLSPSVLGKRCDSNKDTPSSKKDPMNFSTTRSGIIITT